ncbi:glycoside hydrolase family 19 protein [Paraburkholderia tagetis]|uniref:Lytic transglycosylase domain-containing protein n=1 Tax=Paraburkholderia tagetis TaxID=2913261 RepID=A0A9X1ULF3_9BURK|nr:lytic transglycosylase domain-containing protein [Paraburkholderia tagetis]MCG5077532.1 lytic transglycosylase domain-containing protein [Paraburkholderia tagetis]
MTTQANSQPATTSQPAPPQVWRYPFPVQGGKEITDPQILYRALGRMEDGFFPLGVNGFPHGGVHFGAGSARELDQSQGVRVIANGEIVAFKLDDAYEHINFTQDHRWGMYSTGFVLVRHQMTMPPVPGSTAAQPADETLTFYSIYMHMADWQTYLADGNLVRPGWWPGVDAYRIGNKDRQTGEGGAVGAFVCKAPGGQRVALLPEGSEVIIGEKRGRWGHIKSITSGTMIAANSGGYFGREDGGNVPWLRPDGDEYGTAPLTTEGDWGWINYHDQRALKEPQNVGQVVVPPQPIQVTAGTLLGQLGEYHDYERSTPMPPVPARQLLHLEVFAGEELKPFIERSRARAAQLPADGKTILLIQAGAKLVPKEVDPDLTLGHQLVELTLAPNSPKVGPWILAQPWTSSFGGAIHNPDGSPVWIRRDDQSKLDSPNSLKAWSRFPLQLGSVADPANGTAQAMSHAQLDSLDKNRVAADDRGVQWWRIDFGTADNKAARGWVCGKDHPGTNWESPWAWPGFEFVDATGINLADAFKRNLVVCGNADWKEQSKFEPSVAAVNGNALLQRLEQTVARQPLEYNEKPPQKGKNGEEVVTAKKLQRAMGTSWLASELAHEILRYESEWGGGMARWDAITPLMRNARENWLCELTRIRKLQWWDEVKGKVAGFPANPVVNHIHPVALVGNFYVLGGKITVTMLRKIWSSAFVSDQTLIDLANQINENMSAYKLDSEQRLTHFFAQVRTEVGPKFHLVESLDYACEPLKNTFSYFRHHPAEADLYCRNSQHFADQEKIANRAYNDVNGVTDLGNGSVESGDGWKFRGRGLKQLTGKYNYAQFNSTYPSIWPGENVDFVRNPDLVGQMLYGVRSAVFFWLRGRLNTIADQTTTANADAQVDKITAVVNRSTSSYGERRNHYHEIMNQRVFRGVGE